MLSSVSRVAAEPCPELARSCMVRMRDGVRLATDVYLPQEAGPAPAIVVRLPYDKASRYTFFPLLAPSITARGYALVVQDVRGKFGSEGETVAFVHETDDGWDTLDWVANQEWSDGTAGMFGDSYYGFTQWAAVASGHPALKAIVPRMTSARLGSGERVVHPQVEGQARTREVPSLVQADYLSHYWVDRFIYDFEQDWSVRPIAAIFEQAARAVGGRSATLDMVMPHRVPFPVFRGVDPFDARPLPVLHVIGWFDNLAGAQILDYLELASRPEWAPLQYLYADAVDHENYQLVDTPIEQQRDHDADDAALQRMLPRYIEPALDFFDVFVKGSRPAAELPRVAWNLGHAGDRTDVSWPPPQARTRALRLTADGRLTDEPVASGRIAWRHDPGDLVPSTVENAFAFLAEYPDEAATGARDDVLTFTGEPLAQPLDVAGAVELRLALTATGPTTDVFAKLLDVAPDGSARMIVRGEAQVLDPLAGEPAVVSVPLGHTGYRVRPGHRLRLHVSSSDYPLYLPNPGTAENAWLAVETATTTQTIHLGEGGTAELLLSVLDEEAAR